MKIKYARMLFIGIMILTGCQKRNEESVIHNQKPTDTPTPQILLTQPVEEENSSEISVKAEQNNQEQDHATITGTTDVKWVSMQKNEILRQKPEYKNYKTHTFQLEDSYIAIYEAPNSNAQEFMEYHGDIWAYGKDWITEIEENIYISPHTFEINKINEKEYFRYDRSYVTDNVTVFLMLDNERKLRQISMSGALVDMDGKDMTVTISAYDGIYLKSDEYFCGHTWKPQYFYLDDYDLIEYKTWAIEEKEFLTYKGSEEILEKIKKEYNSPGIELHLKFIKRENNLIHINIMAESTDEISYYYETYQISQEQALTSLCNGEGNYQMTVE